MYLTLKQKERNIDFLEVQITHKEKDISNHRTKIDESTASISKLQKDIEDIQKNIDIIRNEINEIEEKKNKKKPKVVSYSEYESLKEKYLDFIDRLIGKGYIDEEYASIHSELPEFSSSPN